MTNEDTGEMSAEEKQSSETVSIAGLVARCG